MNFIALVGFCFPFLSCSVVFVALFCSLDGRVGRGFLSCGIVRLDYFKIYVDNCGLITEVTWKLGFLKTAFGEKID